MAVKPARLREIAQALADHLNLSTQLWADQFTFTAKRSYWTAYTTAALDPSSGGELRVDIAVAGQEWQEESRGSEEGAYGYSIVVQQKVDRSNTAAVDHLIDLVTAFADTFLIGKTFIAAWSNSSVARS